MAITTINAPGAGTPLPFDSVGAAQYPLSKIAFGAEGASALVRDADGARLPVQIGGTLPGFAATPTFNIGNAPTITVTGTVTTGGLTDAQLRATALPVSFTGQSVGVTGTVAISAASLPLPTGAATQATLAALEAKLAALESGRAPVAVQTLATTSRNYGASLRIATSGAGSVRTGTGVTATEITLSATVDGFFAIGDGTVTAADAAESFPIFAGIPFTRQITSGQFVAFIRAGATDGALFIAPVA